MPGARWRGTLGAVVGLVLGVLVLGPALAPGYLLRYDLVHVPRLPIGDRVLGIDGSVPRAVPNDLVVALLSTVVPGWVVQKAWLLGSLVLGAAGAARLLPSRTGALAAAVAFTWNPWVGERIGIGHWGFLLGYATLPWVAAAALRTARGETGARAALLVWLVVASLGGSTAGLLSAGPAVLVLVVGEGGRALRSRAVDVGLVLTTGIGSAAVWWWPFLLAVPSVADPAGVRVFALTSDTVLGPAGSALLGGGIWNDAVVLADRRSWIVAVVALLAVLGALGAAVRWPGPLRARSWLGVVAAGLLGLVVALVTHLPGGVDALTWIVTHVPGGGLLRDGQKFLAWWVLVLALAAGRAAEVARGLPTARHAARPMVLGVVVAALPVVTLPSLGWGHLGAWRAHPYPPEVTRTAASLSAAPPGAVAVLPWQTYRRYRWNDGTVVLDPWNRLVDREVISSDGLPVDGVVVAGEDARAAAIGRALQNGEGIDAMRAAGVRWVLVQEDQPAPVGTTPDRRELDALPVVHRAGPFAVHDLGEPAQIREGRWPERLFGLGVSLVTALAVLGYRLGTWAWRTVRSRPRRGTIPGSPPGGAGT